MSARKRRATRKIAQLVRMDATRSRMSDGLFEALVTGASPAQRYWESCMTPLGVALGRKGLAFRAIVELETARAHRVAAGGKP